MIKLNDSEETDVKKPEEEPRLERKKPLDDDEEKKPEEHEEQKQTTEKTSAKKKAPEDLPEEDSHRSELEQRRNVMQKIKDFDFQIKKNQEDITNMIERLESLSKDLDDLVSLYEIVSEQMNPFVGLSKVTKKRIDALENFTKEIETAKTRIGEIESILEKGNLHFSDVQPKTEMPLPQEPEKKEASEEKISAETSESSPADEQKTTINEPEQQESDAPSEDQPSEKNGEMPIQPTDATKITGDVPINHETPPAQAVPIPPNYPVQMSTQPVNEDSTPGEGFTDQELDEILNQSLQALLAQQNIVSGNVDTVIDEFLLRLK